MDGGSIQILIVMGCYLLFSIGIGLWYAKKSNENTEEYFLGGRSLGPWVAAMSAEASDMSGWLLMGLPGVAYFTGAGEAVWTAIGLAVGTWINWRVVAHRLRSYSQIANNSITIPAFFANRFHDKKRVLLIISAVIILVFFSIYVGAQFVTFGKLFSYVFNMHDYYVLMVILGALFVLAYTAIGGFLAESLTDFIQGILMFVALVLVLIIGTVKAGGIGQIVENLREIPRFTDFFGIAVPVDANGIASSVSGNPQAVVNGKGVFGPGANYSFLSILSCLAWGLGYFGMPQVLLRFMAIRKSSKIKQSRIIAVTWCCISLFAAVAIGMIGRALMPGLLTTAGASENIFIHMAVDFFPPIFAGLILSGILAASMSSSDSYMLIASSALASDLVRGVLKKDASERFIMWVARITLLVVTIFGVWVALSGNDSIFRVVSYAWAGLGAAFGPLMLFSLFWKRTTLPAAIAGMLTGGIMVVVWKEGLSKLGGFFGVYELLPAFIISCIVIFVVSKLTAEPSEEIQEEFEAAKNAEF
ncbi:sodium/proline symporter PutP [Brucepastera parasyntrophica]|uniref:sodium/proline symporter PutP n=1 Tax=Brucepastera parasyntrophica TaxID=2880008 RepID=UPI00210908CB|nr:sodium/proline symporter PutP [Brucepastera parasyntrophica]ULQ60923.1 sodium/proline symporter PutP [Brucepastera parasyntrophica]